MDNYLVEELQFGLHHWKVPGKVVDGLGLIRRVLKWPSAPTKRDEQLVLVGIWPTLEYLLGAEMLPGLDLLAEY